MRDETDHDLSDLVQFCLTGAASSPVGYIVNLTRAQAIELATLVLLESQDVPFDFFYSFRSASPTGEIREWVINPSAVKRGERKRKGHPFPENIKVTRVTKSSGVRPKAHPIALKRTHIREKER
jgi:hypothetical protein